jgi:calcineurin-like phosphoesterase
MTGPVDGVIGSDAEAVIEKFRTKMPVRFKVAEGRIAATGALFELDSTCRRVLRVSRVRF